MRLKIAERAAQREHKNQITILLSHTSLENLKKLDQQERYNNHSKSRWKNFIIDKDNVPAYVQNHFKYRLLSNLSSGQHSCNPYHKLR